MKNLKMKILSIGLLSTVLISSTVFAQTATNNISNNNAVSTVITKRNSVEYPYAGRFQLGYLNGQRSIEVWATNGEHLQVLTSVLIGYKYKTSGAEVRALQYTLNDYGYNLNPDGYFGTLTHDALVNFQSKYGLSVDGTCGPQTWEAIGSYYR